MAKQKCNSEEYNRVFVAFQEFRCVPSEANLSNSMSLVFTDSTITTM